MLGAHIEHLTADHAIHARVFAQNTNTAHDGLRRNILCRRSRLKSRRQQSVTREDCRRFIESLVAGRSAAAQVVVIHARKVIMDERVGMDHLKRTRERQRLLDIAAAQAAEFQHDYRTQALAACHRGVLCGFENAVVTLAGLPREVFLQCRFNERNICL